MALLFVALLGVLIAGCGSDSSDSSGSTEASESGAESEGGSVLAAAEEEVERFEQPQGLENLPKITKPIPEGKKIDIVICHPAACRPQAEYFTEAAEVLGWETKIIDAGESPTEQQAAVDQVLRDAPDGFVFLGVDSAVFTKQLGEIEAAGIPTIALLTTDTPKPPKFIVIPGPSHFEELAKATAATAVVAGGEEATIAYVTNVFPININKITPETTAAIESLCPECTVNEFQLPTASIGKNATALVTNFVRSNPGTNVVVNNQPEVSLGLTGALQGAGVSDVKVVTQYGNEINFADVENGSEYAILPIPGHEVSWIAADALARIFTGGSPDPDIETTAPNVVWTESNLPELENGKLTPTLPDYKSVFEGVWGK